MEKNDNEKVICHPTENKCQTGISRAIICPFSYFSFFGKKLRAIDCKYDDNT